MMLSARRRWHVLVFVVATGMTLWAMVVRVRDTESIEAVFEEGSVISSKESKSKNGPAPGRFHKVHTHLESKHIDLESWLVKYHGLNTSEMLFPHRFTADWDQSLMERRHELAAGGGYVAFNLVFAHRGDESPYVNASYVIVTSVSNPGKIFNALVGTKDMCDGVQSARFRALKLFSSTELLLGAHCNEMEQGPTYVWDFKQVSYPPKIRRIAGDDTWLNSHDIEVLGGASRSMLMRPSNSHQNIEVVDTETGDRIKLYQAYNSTVTSWYPNVTNWDSDMLPDINHAQLVHNDRLLFNSRYFSSFVFVNWTDAFSSSDSTTIGIDGVLYSAGGKVSTLAQKTMNMTYLPSVYAEHDVSLFYGQHNVEMIYQDDRYQIVAMFDNGYDPIRKKCMHDVSRLLIVEIDLAKKEMRELWFYPLDHSSRIYGDADITPSRSMLGCSWPPKLRENVAYDAQAFIVVPTPKENGGELAWSIRAYATMEEHKCTGYPCDRLRGEDSPQGWSMYSVERFWTKPQIRHTDCRFSSTDNTTIRLAVSGVFDVSKWAHDVSSTLFVYLLGMGQDIDNLHHLEIATAELTLPAFWRPGSITLDITDIPAAQHHTLAIKVTNRDGVDSEFKSLTCTAPDSPPSSEDGTYTDDELRLSYYQLPGLATDDDLPLPDSFHHL